MKLSISDPQVLSPFIALVAVAAIWVAVLKLIHSEQVAAERTAATTSREISATYEAQVVRALQEIDQTLKVVKYAQERRSDRIVLQDLKARALLPPDLLFDVSIADRQGEIVARTRPSDVTNVADRAYFRSQRENSILAVGLPRQGAAGGEWKLEFSRRLDTSDGGFAGIVMVSVSAAFFVSGYETAKLGEHGVLGILGTDGVFRARRTGETVSAGDSVDYAKVVPVTEEAQREAPLTTNAWDGVKRYTSARKVYDFPLAVIVGLSADEQLAGMRAERRVFIWRALAASVAVLAIVGMLGRMSRQLARSRKREVDEQVAHAVRIEHLAYHDGLTKLPNRRLFNKLMGQGIDEAHRSGRNLAVLFLDLDGFKLVNDTIGHDGGDQLLQEVAARLKGSVRDSDTVARLGGDEFVILLPDLEEQKYAATVAQKVLLAVARPYTLRGLEFRVTASVGISIYPDDGLDERTLKKNADIAMYQAKEDGKNNFQFYSRTLNASARERLARETGLRQALERKEFRLEYQARRDARSGRITGVEALLGWRHPELGMVPPMQFIPIADETGLIVPIGRWMLRSACLQDGAWRRQGLPPLGMAVSMTARQLADESLLVDLAATLADTGMDPHRLELGIPESLLMHDAENALPILTGLKGMGVRIALDDFGRGYSSLVMLGQFPFDTVKVDRSFIRDGVVGNKDVADALFALGSSLSLAVVARDAQAPDQADFLRGDTRENSRGFFLDKPMAAEEVERLLRAQCGTAKDNLPQASEA